MGPCLLPGPGTRHPQRPAPDRRPRPKCSASPLRVFGERPDIQQRLREDRSLIPTFIEECPRIEGPVKTVFRMARKSTKLGDVDVPAGMTVMVSPTAANRDPVASKTPTNSGSTARTCANTSRSVAASTRARARHSHEWRAGSRLNASWAGWPTSRSTRRGTDPPGSVRTITSRRPSCGGLPIRTSSSRPSGNRDSLRVPREHTQDRSAYTSLRGRWTRPGPLRAVRADVLFRCTDCAASSVEVMISKTGRRPTAAGAATSYAARSEPDRREERPWRRSSADRIWTRSKELSPRYVSEPTVLAIYLSRLRSIGRRGDD